MATVTLAGSVTATVVAAPSLVFTQPVTVTTGELVEAVPQVATSPLSQADASTLPAASGADNTIFLPVILQNAGNLAGAVLASNRRLAVFFLLLVSLVVGTAHHQRLRKRAQR